MPSQGENIQYLYQVLTEGGNPTIDFAKVGEVLDLKIGAVTKRWSRLKQAMKAGTVPNDSAYPFLWLCVKHSTHQTLNWEAIAKACNLTVGAASKRYSRMKIAFEKGEAMPETPKKEPKAAGGAGTKRKRASTSPKAKVVKEEAASEHGENDGEDQAPAPKPKAAKAKAKVEKSETVPKPKRARTVKKTKKSEVNVKTEDDSDHEKEVDKSVADASTNAELMAELEAVVNAAGGDVGDVDEVFFDAEESSLLSGTEDETIAASQTRVRDWLQSCDLARETDI
ncbi:hypothetical protein BU24DRAFT_473253 [Aaosphaeria arxii CBS 175.79]|uniref:Myb-like DNA-binding domain-containing protein n=1 Tax=Aaosphaeria arxii CBS 175.79 TaxID=1450172 RepID=A0A6A5XAY1_9PLEO|nr:uncharacterized protein BU24DRAFT_473253 [Aaosphaeria arxii CBS 175.79]KAF2010070.1 hypothetical protein BU24DRAFT_473253 [Aaosphaeria arxii CBS 175.79]